MILKFSRCTIMIRLVKIFFSIRQILILLGFSFLFTSCSFNDQPRLLYIISLLPNLVTSETFSVGGTVTGLTGTGLVLQNNGSDNLSVASDGSFTFASLLKQNETYSVTVFTQPTSTVQTCTVTNGSGAITSSNISDIVVSCVASALINSDPPSALAYTGSPYTYTLNTPIPTKTPSFVGTVSSCSVSPSLPTGLSISNTTCAISGTPTVTQAATNYTITASNSFGSTTATISITVNATVPTSLVYSGSPYSYTQNSAIAINTPSFIGTATSCSVNPTLPTGLSIDNQTCAISGTPTAAQAATNYTITATNPFGSTTATISIAVNATSTPPSSLVYTGSPYTYTQNAVISTNTPTVTGTIASCSASPALPTGLSLNTTTCAISGSATVLQTATNHTITASNAFGSTTATINITVRIPAPGFLTYTGSPYVYTQNAAITTTTPTVSGTVTSCSANPTLPTGLSLNATTCAISGTPTALQAATDHTITASNSTGSTNTTINIAVVIPAPSSLTYTGSPYTYYQNIAITTNTPTVTGTVTSCSANPTLPTGLSIDNTTCAISGTPTATQAATSYTITAGNGLGNTTASFTIRVSAAVRRIFITASTFTGDLKGGESTGAAGADLLCSNDSNKPAVGTYKAFIVENGARTADPILDWVLAATTEYIRASDTLSIGTTNGSRVFTFGTLGSSFAAGAQRQYWTGINSIGNPWKVTSNCNGWRVGTSGQTGVYAESDQINYDSIYKSTANCDNPKHLLCVEQ